MIIIKWENVLIDLINIERQGINFYSTLQSNITDEEVLNILRICEQGEKEHEKYLLEEYKKFFDVEKIDTQNNGERELEVIKFPDWKRLSDKESIKEAIILALNLENKSIDYLNKVKKDHEDGSKRKLIDFLLNEEKEHIKSLVRLSHQVDIDEITNYTI